MNAYQRDSNGIFRNLTQHIDNATSANELYPFMEIMPLNVVKEFIKQRINQLHNVLTSSPIGTSTSNIYNPIYSAQYTEMNKFALSISPITDILSTDVIIHTLSFLTTKPCSYNITNNEKGFVRYLRFLPTLSKAFKTIMNHNYFYGSKYPLIIYDHGIDYKTKKSSSSDKTNYDPTAVHIEVSHWYSQLKIFHIAFTNKTKAMDSTLPWRNRTNVIIQCGSGTRSPKTANPNILSILSQINPKLMDIRGLYAAEFRLNAYPSFRNVVFLSINNLKWYSNNPDNPLKWLNTQTFPSLKILKMKIPLRISSTQFNAWINSLNLYALHLMDCWNESQKLDLKISMSELEFLTLGSATNEWNGDYFNIDAEPHSFVKTLDLSKCVSLLGIHFFIKVAFHSIVWNKECSLKFVNVTVNQSLLKQNVRYCTGWYDAYGSGAICSDMVIGHCFFKTKAKVKVGIKKEKVGFSGWSSFIENEQENNEMKMCKKRRSMGFDDLVEYIGNKSNIGWYQFMENALLSEAYFVKQIAKNFPQEDDDDDDDDVSD